MGRAKLRRYKLGRENSHTKHHRRREIDLSCNSAYTTLILIALLQKVWGGGDWLKLGGNEVYLERKYLIIIP